MNYEDHIEAAINRLHEEGRYRTFIDIERERGIFLRSMEIAKR